VKYLALATVMNTNLPEILENEWYLVRYSGETPEIAFHAAIYHLTEDKEGPGVQLSQSQYDMLQNAAVDRFLEIIVRDLLHKNSTSSMYRGICRSIVNHQRFRNFCVRQRREWPEVHEKAAAALCSFLETECELVKNSGRSSLINCTHRELRDFAADLGVDTRICFDTVEKLCVQSD